MALPVGRSRVPETFEGNGHLRNPPIRNETSARIEKRIPGEVLLDRSRTGASAAAAGTSSASTCNRGLHRSAPTGVSHLICLHAVSVDANMNARC
jgi:hypothetical protein